MSKVTVLNSVKLPARYNEFAKRVPVAILEEFRIYLQAFAKGKQNHIVMNGYLADTCAKVPVLREGLRQYRTERVLSRDYLGRNLSYTQITNAINKAMREGKLTKPSVRIKGCTIIVNDAVYRFNYDVQSKGLTLEYINGRPIGVMNTERQTELLNGDLKFCNPSVCEMKWVREKVCT